MKPTGSRQDTPRAYQKSGHYTLKRAVLVLGSRALPAGNTTLGREHARRNPALLDAFDIADHYQRGVSLPAGRFMQPNEAPAPADPTPASPWAAEGHFSRMLRELAHEFNYDLRDRQQRLEAIKPPRATLSDAQSAIWVDAPGPNAAEPERPIRDGRSRRSGSTATIAALQF
jgi:hypothetical protein